MAILFPNEILGEPGGADHGLRMSREHSARRVMGAIWRRKWLLLSTLALSLVAAVIVAAWLPPVYTAETLFQFDARRTEYVKFDDLVSNTGSDSFMVRSESDVMQSRAIAGGVVDRLKLENDPEFNPYLSRGTSRTLGASVREVWAWVRASFQTGALQPFPSLDGVPNAGPPSAAAVRNTVVNRVLDGLTVFNDGRSYNIRILFTSYDPAKSAAIANAFGEQYAESRAAMVQETTRRANQWLATKLEEARDRVRAADAAIGAFKREHDILDVGDGTTSVTKQQLDEINAELAQAETAWASAEARRQHAEEQIRAGHGDAIAEVLGSPTVQNLRQTEQELSRRATDLGGRYGAMNPELRAITESRQDIDRRIQGEIQRHLLSLKAEADTQRMRQELLRTKLDLARESYNQYSRLQTRLRELQGEADTSRSLFNSIAERYAQTSALQNLPRGESRIVAYADAPTQPSGPKLSAIFGLALAGGGVLGVGLILLRERMDVSLRTAREVTAAADVPCLGMIPNLPSFTGERALMSVDRDRLSRSVFAEAVCTVRTAIQMSNPERPPGVIMITSSVPREGKTVFSAALAAAYADSGTRTLLIDADLRRAHLSDISGRAEGPTLTDILEERATFDDIVTHASWNGLDVLHSERNSKRAQELLGSSRMTDFLTEARKRYGAVIIDTPPVMMVADASILVPLVDAALYVVRWGSTPAETVMAGLQHLRQARHKVLGTVLSRVDLVRHAKYGFRDDGYYYLKYRKHYYGA